MPSPATQESLSLTSIRHHPEHQQQIMHQHVVLSTALQPLQRFRATLVQYCLSFTSAAEGSLVGNDLLRQLALNALLVPGVHQQLVSSHQITALRKAVKA